MNWAALTLIAAGAGAIAIRLCGLPKRRRIAKVMATDNRQELLDILHAITPPYDQKQLYENIAERLESDAPLSDDELAHMKVLIVLLIKSS